MKINLSGLVLLTGVPGSGKTLRMMEYMEAAIASGRPCFACNVDGLAMPGASVLEDPHTWQDLPPTAVLFVDEAQRFFRARRGMVDPPASITAMETIRHDGVCIVMTTQQPTYLDKHIRGLIGHHEHLVEVLPGKASNVYTFRSCREEVTPSALNDATFQLWSHPKRLHGRYKSAEVHTKTLKVPARFIALGLGALGAVSFLAYAFWPSSDATANPAPQRAQAAPAAGPFTPGTRRDQEPPLSAFEFAQRFLPRFGTMPMSAPAYDDRAVAASPEYYCLASGAGKDANGEHQEASVTCLTEQGTRVELSVGEARYLARYGGVYNPYKAPPRDTATPVAARSEAPASFGHADRSIGATMTAPQIGAYGDLGIAMNPGSAP